MQNNRKFRITCVLTVFAVVFCLLSTRAWPIEPMRDPGQELIIRLYKVFGWNASHEQREGNLALFEQGKQELRKYFTTDLTDAILAEATCVKKGGEICNVDFDILYDGSDPEVKHFTVSKMNNSGSVCVRYLYPSSDESVSIIFKLQKTPAGLRISDILYSNSKRSLARLLSATNPDIPK